MTVKLPSTTALGRSSSSCSIRRIGCPSFPARLVSLSLCSLSVALKISEGRSIRSNRSSASSAFSKSNFALKEIWAGFRTDSTSGDTATTTGWERSAPSPSHRPARDGRHRAAAEAPWPVPPPPAPAALGAVVVVVVVVVVRFVVAAAVAGATPAPRGVRLLDRVTGWPPAAGVPAPPAPAALLDPPAVQRQ